MLGVYVLLVYYSILFYKRFLSYIVFIK